MEVMDSRPGDREDDLPDAEPEPASRRGHWLSGLVRADALALVSVAAAFTALVGLPAIRDAVNLFLFNPHTVDSLWLWVWIPPLIAAGVAVVGGLLALRQAAAQDSPGWVRAVAGSATVFGALLAIGFTIMWLYTPDLEEVIGPIF